MNPHIEITLHVEPERDIPVRGNAMTSGNEEDDRKVEDEILLRLNNGDIWAWAHVRVDVRCEGFVGCAHLGGCTYENEEEFRKDDYYASLVEEAIDDLLAGIADTRRRLERAEALLDE